MTYERILKEIKKPNKRLAQRVLQCLVIAVRPLRVEELAEVLAVDFDDAEGIPRLKPDWRWEEQELALLSACSSLIAIVEAGGSRVVQFSHFSVKEFLTSPRLAAASGEISNYHIDLEPAHTILAQACLGILLQVQGIDEMNTSKDHPARYAAENWMTHAQFGDVSSGLHKGMQYLFDANKPHFKMWLTVWDIDTNPNYSGPFGFFTLMGKSPATPLYYAALCGFHDLVQCLITTHAQDVNADGGWYVRPLVAALAGEHFRTANLLRQNGANLDVRNQYGTTPLHAAAYSGNLEVVRMLIEYDPANVNAGKEDGERPLHWVSRNSNLKDGSIFRLLLEHGADVNVQSRRGRTPLHLASEFRAPGVVHLLLKHGADVDTKDNDGKTALQLAAEAGDDEIVKLLREHGTK